MIGWEEYRDSGMPELFVLGMLSDTEVHELMQMLLIYPELQKEIDEIESSLINYSNAQSAAPDAETKLLIMATVDYTNRLMNGEEPTFPPELHQNSRLEEYRPWLSRPDMITPPTFEGIFIKIIGHTEKQLSVIAWLKDGAPEETHTDVYERFLIVEGTCDVVLTRDSEEERMSLRPGDYLQIPLHVSHRVEVTSTIDCKVILQRIAA